MVLLSCSAPAPAPALFVPRAELSLWVRGHQCCWFLHQFFLAAVMGASAIELES